MVPKMKRVPKSLPKFVAKLDMYPNTDNSYSYSITKVVLADQWCRTSFSMSYGNFYSGGDTAMWRPEWPMDG
jgi:hypothetical protein